MNNRYKRTAGKKNADYVLRDIYNEYKLKCKYPLEFTIFSKILKIYNDSIMNEIIFEKMEFKMPYRLGFIRIQKKKPKVIVKSDGTIDKKQFGPDWDATLKLWMEEYPDKTLDELKEIKGKPILRHLNMHSDGWRARFFWDKLTSNVKNQYFYVFKASRTNKNRVSAYIKKIRTVNYFE